MAGAAGRSIQRLRTHVPLIKFKFGKEGRALPAPTTAVASSNTSKMPSSTKKGQTIEFHMLPAKYQRLPLTQEEMDCINLGGPA
ncbi:uncharacterized protein [Apostichopus japonicus]|uniref:uncharacterized protein isoform X2 n=1 Tax=Stichopus japonicus TaxID=307972 RepID=UPI003AB126CE